MLLDSGDDVTALLRVLDELSLEIPNTRAEIDRICEAADSLGGIEALSITDLKTQLEVERQKSRMLMAVLETAENKLTQVVEMLRSYARADVVQSLELHQQYSDELQRTQEKTHEAFIEFVQLQQKVNVVNRHLANLTRLST